MSNQNVNIHKKIYLQIDEHPEITWCEDKINDTDIEYILKSDAVNHVMICTEPWCFKGQRKVKNRGIMETCPVCYGLGIVPKG